MQYTSKVDLVPALILCCNYITAKERLQYSLWYRSRPWIKVTKPQGCCCCGGRGGGDLQGVYFRGSPYQSSGRICAVDKKVTQDNHIKNIGCSFFFFGKTRLIKLDVFSIFFHLTALTSSISQQDYLLQSYLELSQAFFYQ